MRSIPDNVASGGQRVNPIEKVLAVSSSCGNAKFEIHSFGVTGVFVHPIMKSESTRSAEARRQVLTYHRVHLAIGSKNRRTDRKYAIPLPLILMSAGKTPNGPRFTCAAKRSGAASGATPPGWRGQPSYRMNEPLARS